MAQSGQGISISSAPQMYAAPTPPMVPNTSPTGLPIPPPMPGYGYGMMHTPMYGHPGMNGWGMPSAGYMPPMMTPMNMGVPMMMPPMMTPMSATSVVRPVSASSTSGSASGTSSRHVIPVMQSTKTETINGVTVVTIQQGGAPPPPCTIFVGRIPHNLPDQTIRQFLDRCGRVVKWSRESDPTTKRPKKFGYCEFATPHAALRAFRLLPQLDFEFTGQKDRLLLNADKNTKVILEDFERTAPKPLEAGDDHVVAELGVIMNDFKKKFELELQTGLQWKETDQTASTPSSTTTTTTAAAASLVSTSSTAIAHDTKTQSKVSDKKDDNIASANGNTDTMSKDVKVEDKREAGEIKDDDKARDHRDDNPIGASDDRHRSSRSSRHDSSRHYSSRRRADSRDRHTSSSRSHRSRAATSSRRRDDRDRTSRSSRHHRSRSSDRHKKKEKKKKSKSSSRRSSSTDSSSSDSSSPSRSRSRSHGRSSKKDNATRARSSRSHSRDRKANGNDANAATTPASTTNSNINTDGSVSSIPPPPPTSSLSSSSSSDTLTVPPSLSGVVPPPPATPPPGALVMEEGRSIGFSMSMGSLNKKRTFSSTPSTSTTSSAPSSGRLTTATATASAAFAEVDHGVDSVYTKKKAKLTPLDFTEEELKAVGVNLPPIPRSKVDLYRYDIQWKLLDMFDLMNTSVHSFVVDAVKKYLGQNEDSLVEFIMSMVKEHKPATHIQAELEAVMPASDAETMVMSLWTKLIELTRSLSTRL